nr:MAG TPA: hypothetical protein [Caudoviricetes sp.]
MRKCVTCIHCALLQFYLYCSTGKPVCQIQYLL